jgi:hypothetical protein
MLRLSDGISGRVVKRAAAVFWLPACAWCLTGYVARAEQPVMAAQNPRAQSAPARPDLAAGPARGANLNVDLDASADYYRGYRDALRDAARMSQPYGSYRGRANAGTAGYRIWPPSAATNTTTDARQQEASPRSRSDPSLAQERREAEVQTAPARPPQPEPRPVDLMGRTSDQRRAAEDRSPPERSALEQLPSDRPIRQRSSQGRLPPNAASGAPPSGADGQLSQPLPSHPLPMPQSSLPQSYMLQPTPLQSQTLASGIDPAARPR